MIIKYFLCGSEVESWPDTCLLSILSLGHLLSTLLVFCLVPFLLLLFWFVFLKNGFMYCDWSQLVAVGNPKLFILLPPLSKFLST